MTHPTHIAKSHYGWRAETTVELGGNRILNFVTMKRSNGALVTTANCGRSDGNFFSFVIFQDFSERVITETPARVTEKVVTDQHLRALRQLDAIKARCAAYYATKSTETADA